MTGWQVLDLLDYEGPVATERGALVIGSNRVPVADLAMVLLGQKTRWGFGLVDKAVRFDFSVLVCDWRSIPIASLTGWSENTRVAARHRAQAVLTEPRRKNAWMRIVQEKVLNQALVLETLGSEATIRLRYLAKSVRSGDPSNVEGQAAALYWSSVFGQDFRRSPESPDIRNAALNYGYTLLRGIVIREVIAAGLAPSLAIFHHGRSNTFALADDLIEIFRPSVDLYVATHVKGESTLDREVKSGLLGVLRSPFESDGSTVATSIRTLCQQFAMYVEGERAKLAVPKWDLSSWNG